MWGVPTRFAEAFTAGLTEARAAGGMLLMAGAGLLLSAACAHAQETAAPRVSNYAQERMAALAAYDAGPASAALPALQHAAPHFPKDFAVQEALGLTLAELEQNSAALTPLQTAAALRPGNAAARANLGADLLALKLFARAVDELRAATALQPAEPSTLANLGRALYFDHQPKEAAAVLEKASGLAPADADLRFDQVQALSAAGENERALQVLQGTASALRSAALEGLWGDVAERAGKFQEAEAHLQRAAELEPTEAHLYAWDVELLRHWTWQPAEQVAEFALQRFPESRRLRFAKGVALYGATKFPQAADVFADLLRNDPGNLTYGDLLGRSCAALGGTESANCGDLVPLARQHPENARLAAFAAINILHKPEDAAALDTAEDLLKNSLARDPGYAEAWYQLGVLQQQRQQWAASEQSLRTAIHLRPSYAEAHYRLSRALAHTGDHAGAAQELAFQQQYAAQEKAAADAQLRGVTIFLTGDHPDPESAEK